MPLSWLPVDPAFIPDIISFGRMGPVARAFMVAEVVLSVSVVVGTFVLVLVRLGILK